MQAEGGEHRRGHGQHGQHDAAGFVGARLCLRMNTRSVHYLQQTASYELKMPIEMQSIKDQGTTFRILFPRHYAS